MRGVPRCRSCAHAELSIQLNLPLQLRVLRGEVFFLPLQGFVLVDECEERPFQVPIVCFHLVRVVRQTRDGLLVSLLLQLFHLDVSVVLERGLFLQILGLEGLELCLHMRRARTATG